MHPRVYTSLSRNLKKLPKVFSLWKVMLMQYIYRRTSTPYTSQNAFISFQFSRWWNERLAEQVKIVGNWDVCMFVRRQSKMRWNWNRDWIELNWPNSAPRRRYQSKSKIRSETRSDQKDQTRKGGNRRMITQSRRKEKRTKNEWQTPGKTSLWSLQVIHVHLYLIDLPPSSSRLMRRRGLGFMY